jgi:hypothetical protein
MNPEAVVVGMCIGIAGLVALVCDALVRQAERRAAQAEAELAAAMQERVRLDVVCRKQERLIEDMRRHIDETADGWVTYQRRTGYKAVVPVQVVKVWMN